ncbi:MAG TPA: hypothetical protein VE972_04790 [Conexibacter sp.]|nr:hypothetical protein [Conexibacter sp.]
MPDEYSTMSSGGAGDATVRASGGGDDHGIGWVIFAGTMLMIVGILNFIYGIAAISNSKFYVRDAQYIVSSLNTWGWIILIIGVLQFFAAISIWGGTEWGRWVGVLTAGVNAIAQLIFLPAYPFLSLALFAVDILIIYGLLAYAGRKGPAGTAAGY